MAEIFIKRYNEKNRNYLQQFTSYMEQYSGVKFHYIQKSPQVPESKALANLNHWAWLFAEFGLAPLHRQGAYGNFSCRKNDNTFFISSSGMVPEQKFSAEKYCLIRYCDKDQLTIEYHGKSPPSSETLMHYLIYQRRPDINVILHGHNTLLLENRKQLNLQQTSIYHSYGTKELATAASCLAEKENFFIIKNHGFVALGKEINATGQHTLDMLKRLIQLCQDRSA